MLLFDNIFYKFGLWKLQGKVVDMTLNMICLTSHLNLIRSIFARHDMTWGEE